MADASVVISKEPQKRKTYGIDGAKRRFNEYGLDAGH